MKKTVFRHDISLTLVILGLFLPLLFCSLISPDGRKISIVTAWFATLPLIYILFPAISTVEISNEEITVTNWSGRRTLNWDEITEASLHFSELRLYNKTHNKMLVVDLGVQGYETVLEFIVQRRYILLRDNANFTISNKVFTPPYLGSVVTLIFILISIYRGTNYWMFILICYIIFQSFAFFSTISEIQTIKGIVHIKYLWRTVSYTAGEVASISLEKKFTRRGTPYDILSINLKSGKKTEIDAGCMKAFIHRQLMLWHTTYDG